MDMTRYVKSDKIKFEIQNDICLYKYCFEEGGKQWEEHFLMIVIHYIQIYIS